MSTGKRKMDEEIKPDLKRLKKSSNSEDKSMEVDEILTPFGIFGRAPMELMHRMFTFFSASQLISMASCSKAYATEIGQFLLSKEAAQKFSGEVIACENQVNRLKFLFCDYGHLINVCGSIATADKHIQLLLTFFQNSKDLVDKHNNWGQLFSTVTLKWDYEQRLQFFRSLLDIALGELIDRVMQAPITDLVRERIEMRQKLRGYFLDVKFKDPKDAAFWFSAILRLQRSAYDQARLLHTLYSPTATDEQGLEIVDYRNLAENDIVSVADADERLSQLAGAFGKLIHAVGFDFHPDSFEYGIEQLRWSKPEIFNLVEEVTTFPEPWPMQNFVAILLQCPKIIPIAISYRIIHGFADEAGTILFMLNTVALRWRPDSSTQVYDSLKEALKLLSSRHSAMLFEKVMQEQMKHIHENWPFEQTWNQNSVRQMMNAFHSMRGMVEMFKIALPMTYIFR